MPILESRDTSSPEQPWSEEEEEALRLWIALARCHRTFSRSVSAWILEQDLTLPQFGILEALHHLGPLTLGELAGKLLVTGGNVTYVMDRLEKQGLVERGQSPSDRRVVTARLTDAGTEVMAATFPDHAAFIQKLTAHLSSAERCQLRELLKKLGKGVNDEDERA